MLDVSQLRNRAADPTKRIDFDLTALQLQMQLLEYYGLYVRDCSNKTGLDQYHIRVASQGEINDEKLVAALREIYEQFRSEQK